MTEPGIKPVSSSPQVLFATDRATRARQVHNVTDERARWLSGTYVSLTERSDACAIYLHACTKPKVKH